VGGIYTILYDTTVKWAGQLRGQSTSRRRAGFESWRNPSTKLSC